MLTVENVHTAGWEPALRGMRNPLDSWAKADSSFDPLSIGPNDESLMRRLIGMGSPDHCKFRRMLAVWCDVTAPLYWLKEWDTYKVATVSNSCSTMHTILRYPFTVDQFSTERMTGGAMEALQATVERLNVDRGLCLAARRDGLDGRAKVIWDEIIQLLPSSWNQRRTVMFNYETMANIYRSRRNHKLAEWHQFIDAMLESLPYPWVFTAEGC